MPEAAEAGGLHLTLTVRWLGGRPEMVLAGGCEDFRRGFVGDTCGGAVRLRLPAARAILG